jgi:RNA polymerase sigma-70 factor (ECF subfamily)
MTDHFLEKLKNGERLAQRQFYDQYARLLFLTAYRYLSSEFDAGSAVNLAFLNAFKNIDKFTDLGNGSMEAWLRKIVINESLMIIRNRKKIVFSSETPLTVIDSEVTLPDHLEPEYYFHLIQALPDGYRTVFNLYAIEGYTHQEIAETLLISESTSRSQLTRARAILKENIKNQKNI